MNLKFELSVGLRFLLSRQRSKTLSVNTIISTGGVTVGVAALIATLAIMTGFKEDVRDKILGANAHIVVMGVTSDGLKNSEEITAKIKTVPGVIGASPYVYSQVLLSFNKKSVGVVLRGIDPASVKETTSLSSNMVTGNIKELDSKNDSGKPARKIIIGKEIAYRLSVFTGDKINVLSPDGEIGPLGIIPRMRKYEVAGIFDSGMYEYDSGLAYISLEGSQKFFNMDGRVSGIEVKVDDIYKAADIANLIEEKTGLVARDWQKLNKNLFSALELEKAMMFIVLILIILVASFNILGTLSMMIIEKSKEIGVLQSLGAESGSIMRIFMLEGALIGITGTIIGLPIGLAVCFLLQKYYSLPSDVYYIDHIPVTLRTFDIALVVLSAIFISLLATYYPARLAASGNPSESIRYE